MLGTPGTELLIAVANGSFDVIDTVMNPKRERGTMEDGGAYRAITIHYAAELEDNVGGSADQNAEDLICATQLRAPKLAGVISAFPSRSSCSSSGRSGPWLHFFNGHEGDG